MSYYKASNVDIRDAATQQNFLCSSLDTELITLTKQCIQADSPIPECIAIVKDIFLENYPLFTRCWNFFSERQPTGEYFSMSYARLQSKALDADIYSMSSKEIITVQLIAMTTDTELQKELLKLKNPYKKW